MFAWKNLSKADPILGKFLISRQNPKQLTTNILLHLFVRSSCTFWDSISLHIGNVNGLCLQNVLFPKESSHPYTMPWLPYLIFSQINTSSSAFLFWVSLLNCKSLFQPSITEWNPGFAWNWWQIYWVQQSWLPHLNVLILYSLQF